jgi:acetyltransferase-like isoleucine patch superfamily enzyme
VIGESVHIGAGATLIQGIEIGFGAVIAAGAVVTADVKPLTLVAGMPARRLRAIDDQELA